MKPTRSITSTMKPIGTSPMRILFQSHIRVNKWQTSTDWHHSVDISRYDCSLVQQTHSSYMPHECGLSPNVLSSLFHQKDRSQPRPPFMFLVYIKHTTSFEVNSLRFGGIVILLFS